MKNRDEKDLVTAVIESLADSPKTSELDPLTNQQVEDRVADRALKKLYAKWFIGILIAQLLLMNYIFIKVGYGKLNFNQWTLELYVTSTILEVFGVVVVITNNLFPKKSNIGRA